MDESGHLKPQAVYIEDAGGEGHFACDLCPFTANRKDLIAQHDSVCHAGGRLRLYPFASRDVMMITRDDDVIMA